MIRLVKLNNPKNSIIALTGAHIIRVFPAKVFFNEVHEGGGIARCEKIEVVLEQTVHCVATSHSFANDSFSLNPVIIAAVNLPHVSW